MSSFTWTSAQPGNWSTSANWTPDGIPGAAGGDTATINATGADYTITYDETAETLNFLTIDSGTATLSFNMNDSLTINQGTTLAGTINLLNSGAVLKAATLTTASGSTINIGSGATLNDDDATVGGVILLNSGATLNNNGTLTTASGSTMNLGSGAMINDFGGAISVGGVVDITGTTAFGATNQSIVLSGLIEATGGIGTVNFSDATGTGTLEANGATLLVTGSLGNSTLQSVISNSAASVFEANGPLFSDQPVSFTFLGALGEFQDNNAQSNVILNAVGLNAGSSTTIPTNFIDLSGGATTITSGGTGTKATGTVVLNNGDTLNISGITGFGTLGWAAQTASDGSGGTEVFLTSVCYAAGTHILTATGERMVESLMQGDIVLTLADGELIAQPVKWIGRRRIDLTAHPHPETVAPIRIRRGAFADNMPHSDLLVSPDHAVFVDGKLICARQLVNGTTIRQENGSDLGRVFPRRTGRACDPARGGPAGGELPQHRQPRLLRQLGRAAGAASRPDGRDGLSDPRGGHRARRSCRTRPACGRCGSAWPSVRRRWASRRRGSTRPAIRNCGSLAKGRTVRPLYGENGLYIFALPKGATEVRLVSRAGSPADARPWLDDRRCLGVNVERIVLRGASEMQEIPVDHPDLSQGWQAVERDGMALRRWTNGDAVLPLPTLGGPTMLEIRIGSGGMAYVISAERERCVA